jgi:hypothetical protein
MVRVTLTLEGEIVIDRVLAGLEARASNLAPAWPAVLQAFQAITARAFASEGASTGAAWAPLTPATQRDRVRQGFPAAHPILQRTGKLMRALTLGEGAYASMTASALTYRLSSEVDYFKYHQSNRARTKLPRRAPVLLTADDRTALMHPVRLYLTGRDPNAPRRGAPRL